MKWHHKYTTTINDAVHAVMAYPQHYSGLVRGIIDSPPLQRLRHIKQMGLTEFVYPSATHTRFNHSLGTGYLAYKMLRSVGFEMGMDPDLHRGYVPLPQEAGPDIQAAHCRYLACQYAIAGALLHDIGHGPFSHLFEKVFTDEKRIRHELWGAAILAHSSVCQQVLSESGIVVETLQAMIAGGYREQVQSQKKTSLLDRHLTLAADIIASQLDADRMDFLPRDSYFCGVEYGKLDIGWIIKHMTVIEDQFGCFRLGVNKKAEDALEHYLLARRRIYRSVSLHHTAKVAEEMMAYFLQYLVVRVKSRGQCLPAIVYLRQQGLPVASAVVHFFSQAVDYQDNKLDINQFISRTVEDYIRMQDADIWILMRELKDMTPSTHPVAIRRLIMLAKKLYQRQLHEPIAFSSQHQDGMQGAIRLCRDQEGLAAWQLFCVEKAVCIYQDASKDPRFKYVPPIYIYDQRTGHHSQLKGQAILESLSNRFESQWYLVVDKTWWSCPQKRAKLCPYFSEYIPYLDQYAG